MWRGSGVMSAVMMKTHIALLSMPLLNFSAVAAPAEYDVVV